MVFGKDFNNDFVVSLFMNERKLDYVREWRYLGVVVSADKHFSCTSRTDLVSFYRSANTVLNVVYKPSEDIQMKLLYSICVPVLTYACGVKVPSSREMIRMNTAVNDCVHRIFTFNRWESETAEIVFWF